MDFEANARALGMPGLIAQLIAEHMAELAIERAVSKQLMVIAADPQNYPTGEPE